MTARFCFVDKVTKEILSVPLTVSNPHGMKLEDIDLPGVGVFRLTMTADRFQNTAIKTNKNLLLTKVVFHWGFDDNQDYRYLGRIMINGQDATAVGLAPETNCANIDTCPNFTIEDRAELKRAAIKARVRSRRNNH
jgi:hypothetical protein